MENVKSVFIKNAKIADTTSKWNGKQLDIIIENELSARLSG